MPEGVCSIDDCGRTVIARGWCEAHYRRWRKHGDPLYTKRAAWSAKYDAADGYKVCSLCDQRRPVGDFHASRKMRDGLQQRCIPCQAERNRETRDPERTREWRREYYDANAEEIRRKRRERHAADPKPEREAGRLYHQKNRDRKRRYDQTRRETRAEQCKAWRTPERSREFVNRRRALKLGATVGDPAETADYIKILHGDPCSYCGGRTQASDHIQPLISGGVHAWWNLTASCHSCNSAKGGRDLLEFLLRR